nr:alpha-hydroxy-acid oxidizing protein [Brucella neotomae]
MSNIVEIADLKRLARRRVPKMFFDYAILAPGLSPPTGQTKTTSRRSSWQRVLVDMTNRSLETTMIGEKVAMPVALAPTGLTGMQHANGEMLAAQAQKLSVFPSPFPP